MIVHGEREFGEVDRVRGHFHVATVFWHVQFLPLIPLHSLLVVAKTNERIELPLQRRSLFQVYRRHFAIIGGIVCFGFGLFSAADLVAERGEIRPRLGWSFPIVLLVLSAGLFVALLLSFRRGLDASPQRARELAEIAGIDLNSAK